MINWQDIDTVFLDMDGTLLDLHFDNHFWLEHVPMRYAGLHSISIEAAEQVLFPRMTELRGQLDWYCTDFWTQELGLPIIELKREVAHLIQRRAQVAKFLKRLRRAQKQLVLFTNAHEHTIELKMEKTGLAPLFDEIISSHALGLPKEINGVWEKVLDQYPFKPERSLFIDDNFSVLDCARAYGIAHLLGIARPDSKGERLQHAHYTLLDSFSEIMPA